MTVEEQSALQQNIKKQPDHDNYDKIREVTGINDRHRINVAIKACQDSRGEYEVADVISYLIQDAPTGNMGYSEDIKTPSRPSTAVTPTTMSQGVGTSDSDAEFIGPKNRPSSAAKSSDVIDLTNESEQDQLQKAIAESLRDNVNLLGGQMVSHEEQEISRVLEQSLQDNKAGTKRKRGDIWFVDPLNPHERKRDGKWPVGLKNVGNTCWFSAVIQSLFHLPVFRKLVLGFVPPQSVEVNVTARRNLRFMQELRRLFAMMIASRRKYVDPSKPVEILKEAFLNASGASVGDSQQDVSEFQHKLLEWLEDAFRADLSRPSSPAPHGASGPSSPDVVPVTDGDDAAQPISTNPMVQLFYGQYLAEGVNEGKSFSQKETFGQFPLQVDGFNDIHESLEAATARGEIEAVSSDVTQKSGQEQWFTTLPPVLTFELSRFQFNQHLGRPEKIHNKLEFPQVIFMDRYMEINRQITRQKREEVKRIKEELQKVQSKLDRFINYGSGPKRFPLQDVLQYALEFAESKQSPLACGIPTINVIESTDVEMESPKSQVSMFTDSPNHTESTGSTASTALTDTPMSTTPTRTPPHSPTKHPKPTAQSLLGDKPQLPGNEAPSPKHVSQNELNVLQSCLRRWRTEVEADVKELQDRISSLEECVNNMYSENELKKHPYKLHAVLVHEGQAASGHYWAYVFSHSRNKWLKFNDIAVSETSWTELTTDSFGGFHNASAYCLMYVDAAKQKLLEVTATLSPPSGLPADLHKYVNDDNCLFEKEILEWDTAQISKAAGDGANQTSNKRTIAVGSPKEAAPAPTVDTAPDLLPQGLPLRHAKLAMNSTRSMIYRAINKAEKGEVPSAREGFKAAYLEEVQRLGQLSKNLEHQLPKRDVRLQHLLVYLLANGADNNDVTFKRVLLEHVALITLATDIQKPCLREIIQIAKDELASLVKQSSEMDAKIYEQWHRDYAGYRKVVHQFVVGVELFHRESYARSLPYLMNACDGNEQLIARTHSNKGLNVALVNFFRKQCLMHVNDAAATHFEMEDNIEDAMETMNRLVLPCLSALAAQDDMATVEEIRDKWCSFLNNDTLTQTKHEKLTDFLSRLFDPPAESKHTLPVALPIIKEESELFDKYDAVMDIADQHGYIEAARSDS